MHVKLNKFTKQQNRFIILKTIDEPRNLILNLLNAQEVNVLSQTAKIIYHCLSNMINSKTILKTTKKKQRCTYCKKQQKQKKKMLFCQRCLSVCFCSRKCGKKYWKQKHKRYCIKT